MNKDTTKRSVLVYGTLRKDQGNYNYLIAPHPHTMKRVTVRGFEMYSNGGFPYIVPTQDPDSYVVADLVEYTGDDWEGFLSDLDALEGYRGVGANNHYDREVVSYIDPEEPNPAPAYIYVASETVRPRVIELKKIESGDWLAHRGADVLSRWWM